jgi:hypothetical protein
MNIAGQRIDEVWAGHPVSFALLTERGHQFAAYYDAQRRLTVAGRKLDDFAWTYVHPPGVFVPGQQRDSNVTGWDSHNYLALALDREGCLHVSGNMHNDPLVYYRTREPFDLSTLERIDRMTGEREGSCTYPVFFKNVEGDLLFRYRDGGSGRGSDLYNIYDPAARVWRRQLDLPLLDGQGMRNAYALDPTLGPDGHFHVVWMWRDTPDCATNHTLSYARSRDFVHWETSRGKPLETPITIATGEVIDPAKNGEGLINMTFNLGFDARQQPVVVYHRYDARGRSQAYAARPAPDGGWDIRQISDWDFRWAFSGFGSIAAEAALGPPCLADDHTLFVDFWTASGGAGRWRLRSDTLEPVAQLPPPPATLPDELMRASSGMEVQTAASRDAGRRWVLRWETLPRNRDLPCDLPPPPSELRLYETPDSDSAAAARVGS